MSAQAKKGVPIYVISGEADEGYPLSFVTECLARFQGFNIYHQIIPGLSHMESSIHVGEIGEPASKCGEAERQAPR